GGGADWNAGESTVRAFHSWYRRCASQTVAYRKNIRNVGSNVTRRSPTPTGRVISHTGALSITIEGGSVKPPHTHTHHSGDVPGSADPTAPSDAGRVPGGSRGDMGRPPGPTATRARGRGSSGPRRSDPHTSRPSGAESNAVNTESRRNTTDGSSSSGIRRTRSNAPSSAATRASAAPAFHAQPCDSVALFSYRRLSRSRSSRRRWTSLSGP